MLIFFSIFFLGVSTCCAAFSLIMDFYGLEGYIEYLRNAWIDSSYTIPLAILGLLLNITIMTIIFRNIEIKIVE